MADVFGGSGNNTWTNNSVENVRYFGGDGNDTMTGGNATNVLYGASYPNVNGEWIYGGNGNDVYYGNGSNDYLVDYEYETGRDTMYGGDGDDTMASGAENDLLYGGNGNDAMSGGTGNDVMYGDAGNDSLYGGNDDDYLNGGDGNDVLNGGNGNDTVWGVNGSDTIYGGAGNDQLSAGGTNAATSGNATDVNQVYGGAGNDVIAGSLGHDSLYGDDGNDNIVGNTVSGSSLIDGGNGDDLLMADYSHFDPTSFTVGTVGATIMGGNGNDTIYGGGGDTLYGGNDQDQLFGAAGNDYLNGGNGSDLLDGGNGNDTLYGGGGGADTLTGGNGDDTFVISGSAGDSIYISDFGTGETNGGNTTQTDNDFVDLTAWYSDRTLALYNDTYNTSYKNPLQAMQHDAADGKFDFIALQGGPDVTFTLVGSGVMDTEHTGVVCFTRGTQIETDCGPVAIEDLSSGDLVLTLDHGHQAIRWIGSRHLSAADLEENPKLRPIRICAGALGRGLPEQDVLVSPQHRVMVRSKIAERMFGQKEVLVPAKQLVLLDGVDIADDVESVDYFHFLFDQHQVVYAHGAPMESLYTGPEALKSVTLEARVEIFTIFPDLMNFNADKLPTPARPLIKGRPARKLGLRHMQNGVALIS